MEQLHEAFEGQDIVYVKLTGDLKTMAINIVQAMNDQRINRIIFISSIDIYDYEITRKGEPEKVSVISPKSLAIFISNIIEHPERYVRENLGINQITDKESRVPVLRIRIDQLLFLQSLT